MLTRTGSTASDGVRWRSRIQTYDSTFGLEPTDALTLHYRSALSPVPSLPAVPVFDDRKLYYDPANPMGSVMNPNTGTQVRILGISALGWLHAGGGASGEVDPLEAVATCARRRSPVRRPGSSDRAGGSRPSGCAIVGST